MSKTKTYIVECWPEQTVEVEVEEDMDEESAFVQAILDHGWIGGAEHTGDGVRFMAWVREKKETD